MQKSKVNEITFNRFVNRYLNYNKLTMMTGELVNAVFRKTDKQLLGYQTGEANYIIRGDK